MTGIIECTEEKPWDGQRPDLHTRIRHDRTEEVGEQLDGWPGGDIVTIRCKNCGATWQMELPQ